MADLSTNPPSSERTAVIKKFVTQLELVESSKNMFIEMFHYLNEKSPQNRQISQEKMQPLIDQMGVAMEQQMFISALFIYRDIDNSELEKVISFYKSESGKTEVKVLREAMTKMIQRGFIKILNK